MDTGDKVIILENRNSYNRKTACKAVVFVAASLIALFIYGVMDSINRKAIINPKSELQKTLLRIYVSQSTRNMTLDKAEVAMELQALSKIVQDKLERLQNNVNCSVPHIVCGQRSNCGFGCHVHHRMFCLMLSFVTNRPLIFNVHSHLAYKTQWTDVFHDMGVNCSGNWDSYVVDWGTFPVTITVRRKRKNLKCPIDNGIPFPSDLLNRLRHVHTKPFLWLVGQFAKFALRIRPEAQIMIQNSIESLNFDGPIVGVHIRRTDKVKEQPISYHPLSQYMEEASNYFAEFHPRTSVKQIYLATEDVTVYNEIKESYGRRRDWNIFGFLPQETTADLNERTDYLFEIIRDIVALSKCDIVICGFTSNICRLVYELMQLGNEDGSAKVVSLDKNYYYNVLGNKIIQRLL